MGISFTTGTIWWMEIKRCCTDPKETGCGGSSSCRRNTQEVTISMSARWESTITQAQNERASLSSKTGLGGDAKAWFLHSSFIFWALYGLTLNLNTVQCGRHFEKLDAIIKEHKVAQIWITHSLTHEYSQRQKDRKRMRVGESRFETEDFVPGFSFLPLSFPGQSGSAETWQESTIMGYFTHSFSFPPIDFQPICSGCVKEGTAIHQVAVQRHAIFMPH